MGAVAEIIKAAEADEDINPGMMSAKLTGYEKLLGMMPTAEQDLKRLSSVAPTAEQESKRNALKWIGLAAAGSIGVGGLLSLLKARNQAAQHKRLVGDIDPYAGMPGREITIPIPHMKKAGGMGLPAAGVAAAMLPSATRAVGSSVGDVWEGTKTGVRKGMEHLFAPTGSAFDKSWFLPAAIAATLGGGVLGYKKINKMLENRRESRSRREIERAKREFEDALKSQYEQSELLEGASKRKPASSASADGGFKFASAMGMVADAFAQAHVTGELAEQFGSLEKMAEEPSSGGQWWKSIKSAPKTLVQKAKSLVPETPSVPAPEEETPEPSTISTYTKGLGRKTLGGYLAALALLTAAGAGAGYSFVRSREKGRRKYDIARDIMRRRALSQPPTVTVEPM